MSQTLDDLRRRARQRADMVDSEFISDAEITDLVNSSLGALYDQLVLSYGVDNFLDGYEFTCVVGQSRYDLPTDVQQAAGLDLQYSSSWYTLERFAHEDRLLYQNATDHIVGGVPRYRYRLRDGHLEIFPAPERTYSCVLNYIPRITKLSASSDIVNSSIVESWLEYVVVDVAIKCLTKEESDTTQLMAEKQLLMQRIQAASQKRDIAIPDPVQDSGNTLYNLRLQTRYRANLQGSGDITDRELNHYINQSLGELHDLMVSAYGDDYNLDGYSFTTVSGQQDYTLPSDFYKLGRAEINSSGVKLDLIRANFAEENFYNNTTVISNYGGEQYHYRLVDKNIRIMPTPNAGETVWLWYTKQVAKLTSDTDTVNDTVISAHLEYVIVSSAIKCLQKLSLSAGAPQIAQALNNLQGDKAQMFQRIQTMIQMRDWGSSDTVTDVYKKGGWTNW